MSRTRILCLGDLHLGRRPSRLPADADRRSTSVAAVWRRAVEAAIERRVRLVLLSGDVVHRANRYFEAFGPLEEGLARLAAAEIDVCAVSGNHDFDVFPRLSALLASDRFHLLGAGGTWQRFTLHDGDGASLVHVDGWSFPRRDVRDDPLATYDLEPPAAGAPHLGLLHCDLDAGASTNAPVGRAGLGAAAPAAWVLGHVHKPEVFDLPGGGWALYPGSPQPLDPTETGPHGAWLVEVDGERIGRPEPLPLATVRWEDLTIDLSGAETSDAAEARIVRAARDGLAELDLVGDPEWLLLRGTLTGRTGAHGALVGIVERLTESSPLELESVGDGRGGARARLVEARDETRPTVDLRSRAEGDDPVALLADLLLALGDGDQEEGRTVAPELARSVREGMREVFETRWALEVGSADDLEEAETGRVLSTVAADLLDVLLEQKEGRGDRPSEADDGGSAA